MTTLTGQKRQPTRNLRRAVTVISLLVTCIAGARTSVSSAAPEVRPNPNTTSAGMLHDGVLTVALEAKPSLWRFSGTRQPMTVAAFSEQGKPPLMPGPLLRVPVGTQLRLTIRNSLDKPLTFIVPAAVHGAPDRITAMDSVIIAPNTVDTLSAPATVPGSYVYRGTLPDGASKISHIAGVLAGTIVVDSAGITSHPTDRLFVIMATEDSLSSACDDTTSGDRARALGECRGRRFMYTINGTEWPLTDRIHATVGDSLHWRVVNASSQDHPMHLHGFYYRVDALSGPLIDSTSRPARGQLVVTQLLTALASMSLTWSPERPGNWLFHCHFALHNTPYAMIAMPDDPDMRDMAGLVIGAIVASRPGAVGAGHPSQERHLRLVAEETPATAGTLPRMSFVLEESGRRVDTHTDWSPQLDLVRGEPVAITIVNHMAQPTSVHWHGVEVEDSYADGAPGFSGSGTHLAPAIAPGDSFVARFTPPRAGTFMYHTHVDEMREELAGLEGALIVHERRAVNDPDDHVFFLKGQQPRDREHPLEIDGTTNPDTIVLHVGHAARFRFLNLSTAAGTAAPLFWLTARPDSVAAIARDTMLVRWQPIAKDAFDLPASARAIRIAEQIVSLGETYDAEYTPTAPGILRLEVRGATGNHGLLIRVPVRVE
ncbi:MAG TPA: multicopper oxidase domain-containing protein [Gemmatimonadaceae bacterium]|nr:multicopper oxidase domain-containing protein [Gemmatimonadaceae bacterium]